MIVKEAFLKEEKQAVATFLQSSGLKLDDDVDLTLYLEDNDQIIGTISKAGSIIKDVAISPNYQSENLTGLLVTKMMEKLSEEKIYNYQLFTKPEYELVFSSLGFKKLVKTKKVVMFEGGVNSIDNVLSGMKRQIEMTFGPIGPNSDIGAVVVNGNPFTLGHQYLVEEVSKKHHNVIVFVVEEDRSEFTFTDRISMAYLATRRFGNVLVLPSSKYIVSHLTFPSYFLKNTEEVTEEMAHTDALIFEKYFMDRLFIKKRYLGSESGAKMNAYNQILKDILKDNVEIIQRLEVDGDVVSASRVRSLLKEGKLEEAMRSIPRENYAIFRGIANRIYGC